MMTSTQLADYLYNKRLPKLYREADVGLNQDLPLKRYINSLVEGGFVDVLTRTTDLTLLVDPETCPAEYVPFLMRSFGLTYFPDIGLQYQRKFLMNLGEILRRRGTYSCVKFLIHVLTGMEVTLSYERTSKGRFLYAKVTGKTLKDLLNIETDIMIIQRFLRDYVPYYITVIVSMDIQTQVVESTHKRGNVVNQTIFADLKSTSN